MIDKHKARLGFVGLGGGFVNCAVGTLRERVFGGLRMVDKHKARLGFVGLGGFFVERIFGFRFEHILRGFVGDFLRIRLLLPENGFERRVVDRREFAVV